MQNSRKRSLLSDNEKNYGSKYTFQEDTNEEDLVDDKNMFKVGQRNLQSKYIDYNNFIEQFNSYSSNKNNSTEKKQGIIKAIKNEKLNTSR
jgi:hypothetical protein